MHTACSPAGPRTYDKEALACARVRKYHGRVGFDAGLAQALDIRRLATLTTMS